MRQNDKNLSELPNGKWRLHIRRKLLEHDCVYATRDEAIVARVSLFEELETKAKSRLLLKELTDRFQGSLKFSSLKPNTQQTYRSRMRRINATLGDRPVDSLSRDEVETYFVKRLKEKPTPSADSLRNEYRALAAVIKYGDETRLTDGGVRPRIDGINLPKPALRNRRVAKQAHERLLQLKFGESVRFRFLARHALLCLLTGARPGEWANVKTEHLDLSGSKTVRFVNTKNGLDRDVPLVQEVLQLIANQLSDRKNYSLKASASDYLFPSSEGDAPYRYSGALRDAKKKGYLPCDYRLHDGRHEFISTNVECGLMDDSALMNWVGHSSPVSMKRYNSARNVKALSKMRQYMSSYRPERLEDFANSRKIDIELVKNMMAVFRTAGDVGAEHELLYDQRFIGFLDKTLASLSAI